MKQFKKVICIVMVLTLSLGICGCGGKTPSDTVTDYLEEIKKGENGDFSIMLNETLDKTQNKQQIEKEDIENAESTKKIINSMKKLTYTINSENINGDSATVTVKVNGPDLATVMVEFITNAFVNVFSQAFSENKMTDEETNKMYDDMLSKCLDNVKLTERTGDISLTKVDGVWKIDNSDTLSKLLINIDPANFNLGEEKEN
ncbi:DUF4878 domain-containing protein [Clostridium fallax]|uniref:Type I secretion C-terminal target domain (VC_A0849 subclass) n=1 Tax=Clostridium fallax TaxID=1533 RepID=A0A1M4TSE4_9CLOT|nr:DUF4878 domain-containing protein [Clostridium fallax]SHE47314.1 type I secretion C-terminal target domain (VC_A0849 subclass) [Clostridium fallax]SQB22421.1 lipoprotein [Clostridium fallax]